MASKQEIKEHVQIALQEVGTIVPWRNEEYDCWVFSHFLYPSVECDGDTEQEVKDKYPLYLYDFIKARLTDHLSRVAERQTKGRGGVRTGAGRPKKQHPIQTESIRLPRPILEVARWLKHHPDALPEFQQLMQKHA